MNIYVYMYICGYVNMFICIYVYMCVYVYILALESSNHICVYVYIYVYMYTCIDISFSVISCMYQIEQQANGIASSDIVCA